MVSGLPAQADVVVIGGGPAGTTAATLVAQQGRGGPDEQQGEGEDGELLHRDAPGSVQRGVELGQPQHLART